jgi:uncharacterized protein (TIGR03437 family)
VRKLNRVVELFALAAVVFVGRPDTAFAANLNFFQNNAPVQNPLVISIAGPGSSNSATMTVTTNGTLGTLAQPTVNTGSGGNWLCATTSGNMLTVSVGSATCGGSVSTSQLQANLSYNGNVSVTDSNGNTGNLQVTVQVGTSSGGSNGLVASQNPVVFNLPTGSSGTSTTVNITFNGAAQTINSVTTSTNSFSNWLQATNQGTSVLISVTPSSLTSGSGSDTGTVTVFTPNGNLPITVNLSVGSGGTSGLAANPNPLTISAAAGSNITQQGTINITNNGSTVALQTVNTSGQSWLSAFISNTGVVTVNANPSGLSGNYSGSITVTTTLGTSINVPVNFNVGTGSSNGLVANPNPLNLNLQFGSSSVTQNVNITYNGGSAIITGVSASTTTGQNWLQAFSQAQGTVSVTVNPTNLSGSYTGTVTVNTTNGTVQFQVNLTVGLGNSSGLVATPSTVTFTLALLGSGVPSQNVNVTYNGSPVTIQNLTFNVNGNWLLAQVTNTGVVTLGCNCASLTMGSYSGTVTANTVSGSVTFQVNVNVGQGGSQGLAVSPSPLTLNLPVGSGSSTNNVNVTFNGSPVIVNSVSTTTTTGQNWLQASTTGITGTVAITVIPSILQTGSYSGTVTINTQTGPTSVVVNLTVGTGSTGLIVTPSVVSLTATSTGAVNPQNVTVSFNGNPVTITSVTSTTTTGQNWLTTSFTPGIPGTVTVNASTTGLATGSYTGTVTVLTLQGTVSFQVNLSVGGGVSGNGLVATPNPIVFSESAPGTASPQIVSVSFNGAPQPIQTFTFAPSLPGLTFINGVLNTDGTVTLTVNSVVSTQGTYTGSLTLYLTNGGSITVPVTLTFGTGTGTGGLVATPNPITFNISSLGAPSTQNVGITFNGAAATITNVVTNTSTGQNWLQAAALSQSTGTVTVTANPFGLTAGTYTGTVAVTTNFGSLSIPVNMTVSASAPSTITLSTTSLSFAYQTGQAQPPSQSVTLTTTGGAQVPFTAAASTNTTPSWLSIIPTSGTAGASVAPSSITANVNAAGLAAGTYSGTITITPTGSSPLTVTVTLTVTAPVVTTPTVAAVQNAASSIPTAVSPGLNILIFGLNMGPATLTPFVVGANGALATTVAGTQVTFDGVPAAIVYTRNTLVSVMVPYEVAGRVSTALVVTYNGVSSTALPLRVVDTQPGIYTLTQTGSGQGAILNQNGSVNGTGSPEAVGNYIQIFGTGEGQTSPAGVDGALLPSRLPLPTPNAAVSVTIGGVAVPATDINYAGEAPGLISGVFQVNAKIPAGVGPGPVPVVIRWGGVASQANVTVSVR